METHPKFLSDRFCSFSFVGKTILLAAFFVLGITVNAQIKSSSVYFDTDKSNLNENATRELDSLLLFISRHSGGKLIISAHTDSDADEKYNKALSQRRLNTVINYLEANTYEKLFISEHSAMGESKPVTSNATDSEKALNRRVEIKYIYTEPIKEEVKKGNIEDLYALLLPEFDEHCIDNSRDTLLVCAKGTILSIPANAFHRETKGCVKISIREALTKSDMVLQNLSTKGSEGILISGGMFEIKASDDDGELRLKSNKTVGALLPTDNVLENAGTYYGSRDTSHQHNLNWNSPGLPLSKGATLPLSYWTNCWKGGATPALSQCDRCRFFCRLGRIGDGFKGITDSKTHARNKEFRQCQKKLRKKKKNRNVQPQNNQYCSSIYLQLQSNGITPDSVMFMSMYGKYMKDRGLKTISETIESLKKDEEARQKLLMQQMMERRREDSIRQIGYNAVGIGQFGFINCDYFPRERANAPLTTVNTDLAYGQDVDCKMIFTEINSIMYSYQDGNKNFCFNNVPKREKVWIMALKYDGEQAWFFIEEMKIGDPAPPIRLEKVTLDEIRKRMKQVDL
jgi:hypothetical protein